MNLSESHTRINENGRVVIPASFRRALGIQPGETVVLRIEDNELRITTCGSAWRKPGNLCRSTCPRPLLLWMS